MAAERDAQRDKPGIGLGPWRHKHHDDAYVANLVSTRELWSFMHAHGGGDRAVAWVAGRQLGLIHTAQLDLAGVGRGRIELWRRRGTLHRVHRGVYLVGHRVPLPGALELAAVLACGKGATVSHRSAAALWRMAPGPASQVEVTVVGRNCRSRPGMRVHRVGSLDRRDRRLRDGIPVTSPARALLEYAATATPDELEQAIGEAYARKLVTEGELRRTLARAPGSTGSATLRAVLDREGGPQWTQSEAERRMLKLIRAARLPPPTTQVRVAGWPADFLWPEHKLIVEVDGYQFHGHRRAFERDRRRDGVHVAAGYVVLRFTWHQLTREPLVVVATIARALDPAIGSSRSAH